MPVSLAQDSSNVSYGSVSGRVLDKNGDPVGNAVVEIVDYEFNKLGTTTTGDSGSYTFNDLPGGHVYRISATLNENGTQYYDKTIFFQVNALKAVSQDVVIFRYPPTHIGWMTGVVTANEHYAVPVSATIYLNNGMYSFFSESPGSQWQFNLPEGDYVVWAEHNDNNTTYMSDKLNVHVRSDDTSSEILYIPLVKNPNVTYNPAPSPQINIVHGVVTQKNGAPLAGVLVQLCEVSTKGSLSKVMETTTSQNGYYEFNGLNVGSISSNYVVKLLYQFNGKDYTKQSDAFTVYYANTVNVAHDYPVSLNVDFVDSSALLIDSSPAGASIVIDGNSTRKVTPYNFTGIKSGMHAVSLQMTGYHTENFTVNVIAENTTRVVKQLTSSTGNAHLEISPGDSLVYINDQYAGMGSMDLNNKPDGVYTYVVSRDGYRNNTGTFQVLPGQDMNVTVSLVAVPGLSLTYISYLINNMLQAIGSMF
jgi:protocatechuate 3,4-dioxygenase beta subunit